MGSHLFPAISAGPHFRAGASLKRAGIIESLLMTMAHCPDRQSSRRFAPGLIEVIWRADNRDRASLKRDAVFSHASTARTPERPRISLLGVVALE